jgi:hypothetical protein
LFELVPLGSAVVSSVFTVHLAKQYFDRRKLHQIIWTISMALFATGAYLEFLMSVIPVSGPLFDVYYLSIGPQVGLLGAGVVYLLRPRFGRYVLYTVLILVVALLGAVLVWPVDISGNVTGVPGPVMSYQQWFQTSTVYGIYFAVAAFAQVPRDITQVLNSLGAILVIGGGVLSFVIDRRRYYAVLIAAGALMNAVGGILLGILGDPSVFLYFEFLGIVLFYLGFILSSRFTLRPKSLQGGSGAMQVGSPAAVS